MIYVVWLCDLFRANLCLFDKLQPILAQFDPALFVSWQKNKKANSNYK